MEIAGKVIIITGGAAGIGAGLAERFHQDGAKHIMVADLDEKKVKQVAQRVGGKGVCLDVSNEVAIKALVAEVEQEQGRIDLFVSNAGYVSFEGLEGDIGALDRMWGVHVKAHVYAARAVLPGMIARGEGYLLNTASAAGLLSQIGSMHYSVTKAAAVGLAEWLQITHANQGIRVSVLCPQEVATDIDKNMYKSEGSVAAGAKMAAGDGVLSSAEVAEAVVKALREERFLVLPHPEVAEYAKRKGTDRDRWLKGMRRFQDKLYEGNVPPGEWLVSKGTLDTATGENQ